MARKRHPEPFWRASRSCWFVQIGTRQIKLDPDRETAFKLYHKLMADPPSPTAKAVVSTDPAAVRVDQVLESYLAWVMANRKTATYDVYRRLIQVFANGIPRTLTVADLKPIHVTRVADANHENWSTNTRRNFLAAVRAAFLWAEDQGLITGNPVRVIPKPPREAREQFVTQADHERILAAVDLAAFRDLLELCWETGLRPQEVRAIEARHVDLAKSRLVFPPSESKGGKRHRVVYLATAKATEIITRLSAAHPTGPIMLNRNGKPWNRKAIDSALRRVKNKAGIRINLGSYRKGFVTQALMNGVDTVTLAALVGHSDGTMISKFYAKVSQNPAYMIDAARRAKGEPEVKKTEGADS